MKMNIFATIIGAAIATMTACSSSDHQSEEPQPGVTPNPPTVSEGMANIDGGAFMMGSPADEAWRMADEVETDILFYPCGSSHLFKASITGTKASHVKDLLPRFATVSIRQPFQRRLVQRYRYLFPCLLHGLD